MAKKQEAELGAYDVRQGRDGKWGIYLRKYNVRLAVFNDNSEDLQEALKSLFDLEARPRHYT